MKRDDESATTKVITLAQPDAPPSDLAAPDASATRARTEEELRHLQEQLAQAQTREACDLLTGGLTHDFTNMIQVILGFVEIALDKAGPDSALHDDLTEIRKAACRSADLTGELLALARQQPVSPRVMGLSETVADMLKILRRMIGADIELAWLLAAGDTSVKMDPAQIRQLLTNLCVNARYAIAGTGKITVETGVMTADAACCSRHGDAAPGEYATLTVSDTGCGMDAATLEHLFDPLLSAKGAGEGSGLGLSTVYSIVRQNKGFITISSEPGKGATFKIHLPRYLGDADALQKAPCPNNETVLLVEDEPALLKMAARMLESLGYRVLTAGTPIEALELAEKHAFKIQLLLTDVVMPGMNGWDLVNNLLAFYPDVKYLFMSGHTANIIGHYGVLEEGVNFIQKPFSLRDLAQKVREALNSH